LELVIEPTGQGRGGFRKPLSTRQFVLEYLQANGESYVSAIHRAYKRRLREMGEAMPKLGKHNRLLKGGRRYKACTLYSFSRQLKAMEQEGLIHHSGKQQRSSSIHTQHWSIKPIRLFYRL